MATFYGQERDNAGQGRRPDVHRPVTSLRDVNVRLKHGNEKEPEETFNTADQNSPDYGRGKGPYIPKLYTVSFYRQGEERYFTKVRFWEVPRKDEIVLFEGKEYIILKIIRDLEIYSAFYAVVIPNT